MSGNRKIKIYHGLRPLAFLFRIGVTIRNYLFDKDILHSRSFPIPVICVGNITVGGTGKTPHTEYLIRLLKEEFQVAVLSRGYKRKSKGFVLADARTAMEEIGDEPYQMAHKFPDIYMAVDRDRSHGIEQLTDGHTAPGTKVIILDDAFQHRYVKAGKTILLIDYNRPIYMDCMLPAGRLREPQKGKTRADIIIVSKCPQAMSNEEEEELRRNISPEPHQQLYFTTLSYGKLQPLFTNGKERQLESLESDEHILLVTGIASPAAIIKRLEQHTSHIKTVTFADHHDFSEADLQKVEKTFDELPEKKLIITTEKDAARLINHPLVGEKLKPYIYVLPVSVEFLNEGEKMFNQNIIEYVRENSRNSSLSEG
ncbi:tetraacyldisaccharide 4'-kinase [uncultured Bacteroides sp.]|uniref:tetraacyldisaccharide 4'-kinase n=1 Tax=uncultured Bacteroides sp. TaxID=162156 RepID=UPI00263400DC|nr:tetraacyldisaccharide 4'-kinase [uncultured Bacteroides sp.]